MPLRRSLIGVGAALVCAVVPATASARIVEVGQAPTEAVPTCPGSPCLAVSRTTGYQAKVGDSRSVYVVPAHGKIVAWTIKLGAPTRRQINYFQDIYGAPSAGITVLRRGDRLYSRVLARGPVVGLSPYLGQTVQFPLERAINVRRGNVIALTVPTWAPALSSLSQDFSSWRASRALKACDDTERQTAQADVGDLAQYRCLYRARLTYTATLVTNPKPNKPPRRTSGRD
jgi:hypothetical protein